MGNSYRDLSHKKSSPQRRAVAGPRKTKSHDFDLKDTSAAIINSATRYPHMVTRGDNRPLKSGHNNTKIGKMVVKGAWSGMPIYTLTLQERDTCPQYCPHWKSCFGNKMLYAIRHDCGPELEGALEAQLFALSLEHQNGFVVRLHILGDFYSLAYVEKWAAWLLKHQNLYVYGYTAWKPLEGIGLEVKHVMREFPARFRMRFSNADIGQDATRTVVSAGDVDGDPTITVCPEQTGRVNCCAECALCWATRKNIAFIAH